MSRNTAPAALDNSFLSILPERYLPRNMAMSERRKRAIITPARTMCGSYSVAKMAEAIWVLSPHSDRKIMENPEIKALREERLIASSSSSGPFFNINMPKRIKTKPERALTAVTGIKFPTYDPRSMANQSVKRKASITPNKSRKYSFVRVERISTESCVLSPISARPTARRGIIMPSSSIYDTFILSFFFYLPQKASFLRLISRNLSRTSRSSSASLGLSSISTMRACFSGMFT